jgi:hypothetical protein
MRRAFYVNLAVDTVDKPKLHILSTHHDDNVNAVVVATGIVRKRLPTS